MYCPRYSYMQCDISISYGMYSISSATSVRSHITLRLSPLTLTSHLLPTTLASRAFSSAILARMS